MGWNRVQHGGALRLFDGIAGRRALLLRALVLSGAAGRRQRRVSPGAGATTASASPPRSRPARSTRPSSIRRRARSRASGLLRELRGAREGGAVIVIPAVDLRDGPLRAAARGARRRRDRVLRRSGGDGRALGGGRRRASARRRPRRRLRRRAASDRAHRQDRRRRRGRCRSRSAAACATWPRWRRCSRPARRGPCVGTRAAVDPAFLAEVCRAVRTAGHRRGRRARRPRGREGLDRGSASMTATELAPARARRRGAAALLYTDVEPRRHRAGAQRGRDGRARPRAAGCPSSPRAAWAAPTHIAALAAVADAGDRGRRRRPRALHRRGRRCRTRIRAARGSVMLTKRDHPLPGREGRPRGQGRAVRRAARRRRSGGSGARLRRAGRRRAGLPRHHRVARGPRRSCSTSCARTAEGIYMPLTVGGGVRTVDDVRTLLRAGADKVSFNTAALARPAGDSRGGRALRQPVHRRRHRRAANGAADLLEPATHVSIRASGLRSNVDRLHARRAAAHRARRHRVGAGSRRAGRGRDSADQHGSRRDQGRLRSRADARGGRRRHRPGDRLRRRRHARALPRGVRRRRTPTRRWPPRSSTSAPTRSAR